MPQLVGRSGKRQERLQKAGFNQLMQSFLMLSD